VREQKKETLFYTPDTRSINKIVICMRRDKILRHSMFLSGWLAGWQWLRNDANDITRPSASSNEFLHAKELWNYLISDQSHQTQMKVSTYDLDFVASRISRTSFKGPRRDRGYSSSLGGNSHLTLMLCVFSQLPCLCQWLAIVPMSTVVAIVMVCQGSRGGED
jgi:hypothetical protein